MQKLLSLLTAAAATLVSACSAAQIPTSPAQPSVTYLPPTARHEVPVHRIFNHSGIGFENLAVRSDGQILATTSFPSALLWYIDPLAIRPPILLQNFTGMQGSAGIVEGGEDTFYVVTVPATGPSEVQSVDMSQFLALPNGKVVKPPVIKTAGSLPETGLLNGMTKINKSDDFVLIADTVLGGVWRLNVRTGVSSLVIQDPSMKGPAGKPSFQGFGINGLKVFDSTLYYTNSGAQKMFKMPVRLPLRGITLANRGKIHNDGSSAGQATLITAGLSCDDFAIDAKGVAYVASPSNALIQVDTRTGAQLVLAGHFNSTDSNIISASSVQFGRAPFDRASVYITTNGGSFTAAPPGSQGVSRVDVGDISPP